MQSELATVSDRINLLLARIEREDYPPRAQLEDTLTDGYACALALDAECDRLERTLSEHAAALDPESSVAQARELSALARLLDCRRRDLKALRDLLAVLRVGVQEARVA